MEGREQEGSITFPEQRLHSSCAPAQQNALGLFTLPCPKGAQWHSPRNSAQKPERNPGWGLSQVSSLPAGKLLLSRARWKPKVMEGTVTAEWQCSVLGRGYTLQWHQLPTEPKMSWNHPVYHSDIFSDSCCNTMNVLYKYRKSKVLLQLNQRHQGDLQGMLFQKYIPQF